MKSLNVNMFEYIPFYYIYARYIFVLPKVIETGNIR